MFAKAEVVQLFPTCVWEYELSSAADLNRELSTAIEALRASTTSRSRESGTWQSVGDLHNRPEFKDFMDLRRIGGFVAKSLTLLPRSGNKPPRIGEVRAGMLNAISLENVGVEAFISEKLPKIPEGVPVIASLFGTEIFEYAEVAKRLTGVAKVKALEINASCPHVKSGGIEFGQDPRVLAELVRVVRAATDAPILVIGCGDPTSAIHAPNESQDLGVLEKSVLSEAIAFRLLAERA